MIEDTLKLINRAKEIWGKIIVQEEDMSKEIKISKE
jgi:hypothetical protein